VVGTDPVAFSAVCGDRAYFHGSAPNACLATEATRRESSSRVAGALRRLSYGSFLTWVSWEYIACQPLYDVSGTVRGAPSVLQDRRD
jgi:hypothetical protein